jgi:hypothetical protein
MRCLGRFCGSVEKSRALDGRRHSTCARRLRMLAARDSEGGPREQEEKKRRPRVREGERERRRRLPATQNQTTHLFPFHARDLNSKAAKS